MRAKYAVWDNLLQRWVSYRMQRTEARLKAEEMNDADDVTVGTAEGYSLRYVAKPVADGENPAPIPLKWFDE